MAILIRFILLLIFFLQLGCTDEAPRDNIFDSASSLYGHSGTIVGTITGQYPPYGPVDSVRVELIPENKTTYSDNSGDFSFEHLIPGNYLLYLTRKSFSSKTDSINVESGQISDIIIQLNGQPIIDSVRLMTKHIAHWWPIEHEYVLEVEISISDYDGALDIDSVILVVPEIDFSAIITERVATSRFSAVYYNSDFPPETFAELPGRSITFQGIDQSGQYSEIYHTQVSRIISTTPGIISPGNQELVGESPVFRWLSFSVGYGITYSVDVFRLNESGIPLYILGSEKLSITTFQWQSGIILPPALYYWTLTVTDWFGNISISKEATFIVQ